MRDVSLSSTTSASLVPRSLNDKNLTERSDQVNSCGLLRYVSFIGTVTIISQGGGPLSYTMCSIIGYFDNCFPGLFPKGEDLVLYNVLYISWLT
jgi:hypothetical protein